MPKLVYREPQPISRSQAKAEFDSEDPPRICTALVDLVYHDPDWRWLERTCLTFSNHADPQVRGVAATCLGHIARIHGRIDTELVIARLNVMLHDPATSGQAQDALDDIASFGNADSRPPARPN